MGFDLLPVRDLRSDPLTVEDFESATNFIAAHLPQTPQLSWPLLSDRLGCDVFAKHENYLPTGSFKVRGGVWLIGQLFEELKVSGVIAASRGNHGQSISFATGKFGIPTTIVVPFDNNPDKNRAMEIMGAEVIEFGRNFDDALTHATKLCRLRSLQFIPSFHSMLVQGVGTYAYEFLKAVPGLDVVYVPIGLGSGLAGFISAKEALGMEVEIVGVVSEKADAYALSLEQGKQISTSEADTVADGLAVCTPSIAALDFIAGRVSRIIRVSDELILEALRICISDVHNLVEPAGAASLAGLMSEKQKNNGKRAGIVLSGGNVDSSSLVRFLQ